MLEEGVGFKIERIEVEPGNVAIAADASPPQRTHRIMVVRAKPRSSTISGQTAQHQRIEVIPADHKHRLENPGLIDVVMISYQNGEYLSEDDAVRFK
ncbi:MAG: hypothetical protein IPP88_22830 [Betaproteobacteria bacterium]|nr:hypothetical protein [Betaproteobacteria bacterium]